MIGGIPSEIPDDPIVKFSIPAVFQAPMQRDIDIGSDRSPQRQRPPAAAANSSGKKRSAHDIFETT
jgi:hypothetical protein